MLDRRKFIQLVGTSATAIVGIPGGLSWAGEPTPSAGQQVSHERFVSFHHVKQLAGPDDLIEVNSTPLERLNRLHVVNHAMVRYSFRVVTAATYLKAKVLDESQKFFRDRYLVMLISEKQPDGTVVAWLYGPMLFDTDDVSWDAGEIRLVTDTTAFAVLRLAGQLSDLEVASEVSKSIRSAVKLQPTLFNNPKTQIGKSLEE